MESLLYEMLSFKFEILYAKWAFEGHFTQAI